MEKAPATGKWSVEVKTHDLMVLVFALAFLGVAYMAIASGAQPTVEVGDTVKVEYTGRLTNGQEFDSSKGREPLQFEVGSGQLIKGFDSGVIGMRQGEKKTITIPPAEAYGEKNPELIVTIPREQFASQEVRVGMQVSGEANGRPIRGTVTQVDESTITVDFNPPLAGQTLVFEIEVVEVSKKA